MSEALEERVEKLLESVATQPIDNDMALELANSYVEYLKVQRLKELISVITELGSPGVRRILTEHADQLVSDEEPDPTMLKDPDE